MRLKALLVLFCLAASMSSFTYAAESTYQYDVVAQYGTKIDGLMPGSFTNVAINDFGTVVFQGHYDDGSYAGATGVFSRNHVLLKKGDVVRGLTVVSPTLCGVNNFDEVAMVFSYPTLTGGAAIAKFVRHGPSMVPEGKIVKLGDTIDGLTIRLFRECKINDVGEIVFAADYTDSTGSGKTYTGIFQRNKLLVGKGSVIGGVSFSENYTVDHLSGLSDFGTVVFDAEGSVANEGSVLSGAFSQHRALALSGQTLDGILLQGAGNPVISHFGRVAFSGTYALQPNCTANSCMGFAAFGPRGVVVARTGDTISGITLDGASAMSINDEGEVLMQASFNHGNGYGLFTKRSAVAVTGDKINGTVLEGFVASQLNDFGNVAFTSGGMVIIAKPCNGHGRGR